MFILERTRGIESRSVSVSATSVSYSFDSFRNAPFVGMLLADLQQPVPEDTTPTLPVTFGTVQVLTSSGSQATVADIGGVGVQNLILCYYNSRTNRLQLIGRYNTNTTTATT